MNALITNPLFGRGYLVPSISCDAAATTVRFQETATPPTQNASKNTDTTRQH